MILDVACRTHFVVDMCIAALNLRRKVKINDPRQHTYSHLIARHITTPLTWPQKQIIDACSDDCHSEGRNPTRLHSQIWIQGTTHQTPHLPSTSHSLPSVDGITTDHARTREDHSLISEVQVIDYPCCMRRMEERREHVRQSGTGAIPWSALSRERALFSWTRPRHERPETSRHIYPRARTKWCHRRENAFNWVQNRRPLCCLAGWRH